MRLPSWSLFSLFALVVALAPAGVAEENKNLSASPSDNRSDASSAVTASAYAEPKFVGLYAADGYFKTPENASQLLPLYDDRGNRILGRPPYVPPWVNLHSSETVIEDLAPPARPRKAMKRRSFLSHLRDSIITAAYGSHELVLLAPTQVTSDSHQRLIISDPIEPAIHVLDGDDSFRILCGPGHRMQSPNSVAVDANDNIYVADGKLGLVLVYDPQGHFLRHIGYSHGENMFQTPTSIAIDRQAARLYVLDSPLNEIVVLDLSGKAVKRIGGIHSRNTTVNFDRPTAIAVGNDSIVVMDTRYSRVNVLDLDGNLRNEFAVRPVSDLPITTEVGIALDNRGNIYTSHFESGTVRIYKQTGELIGTVHKTGVPTGVWVDSSNRIFVADPNRAAVNVFQASK